MPLQTDLAKVLFLDIETVPQHPTYKDQPDSLQTLWDKKAKFIMSEGQEPEDVYQRAGIYAEFGKVICISVGAFSAADKKRSFRLKSFCGDEEEQILTDFAQLLKKHYNTAAHRLCAHNGKEFDFPYLCRRMMVHGIPLPGILDIQGKKPWEIAHLDTLELWKFGDFKHYTSLELLAYAFGIPTPKDDIEGSQVADVYWKEKDIGRIAAYCQKDVLTVAQILLKYMRKPILNEDEITLV